MILIPLLRGRDGTIEAYWLPFCDVIIQYTSHHSKFTRKMEWVVVQRGDYVRF